jgi:DNA-binding NtrC family response regulator
VTTQEISVLLVGDRLPDIERLLQHTRWRVQRADTVAEAKATLNRVPVQVVLCQPTLRDGTWSNLLNAAQDRDLPAAVVVLSKPDDRIWAEVLSSGAYDLLPFPCTAAELYAIVPMAWRHCMQQEAYHQLGKPVREPS